MGKRTYFNCPLRQEHRWIVLAETGESCDWQCDQMTIKYVQYLDIYTNENLPNIQHKDGKVGSKYQTILNKLTLNISKDFKKHPKCLNFVKSGHTGEWGKNAKG